MKFKKFIQGIWRFPFRFINKTRLKNHEFSIISSNCIGGGYYHDVFQQFRTPTINLTITDFVRFVENLKYYISVEMVNAGIDKKGQPLGKLDDVVICGVHYKSFDDLKNSWDKRKTRINYNNLFIVCTDEFVNTKEQKERLNNLHYPKICFISKKTDLEYAWQIYLPGYEDLPCVGDSMMYCDIFGRRVNEKYFDFVYWLNCKKIKRK